MDGQAPGVTAMLRRWSAGDRSALEELTPLVYDQLRALASAYLRRERADHTLQPTALIHEAYLRLMKQAQCFESRRQFYGVAAHLMRSILVDHARAHRAEKRGGDVPKLSLDDAELSSKPREIGLLALDEALDRLTAADPRKGRVVELRYFGGLRVDEIAELLEVSVATVNRELRFAENWLCGQLSQAALQGVSDSDPITRSLKQG